MNFRQRLKDRHQLKGMLLTTNSCELAEAISLAGLDWGFIDLEHAPLDFFTAQQIVRALGERTASIIRIPDQSVTAIKRALDTGCDGIIVPQVGSAGEAKQIIEAAKYAPMGARSVGISRAQGYGSNLADYLQTANDKTAIILQIESRAGVEEIENILAVPNIDAIFIGPYDLSSSLGLPGQIDHPTVKSAIDRTLNAAAKTGIAAGIFCQTIEAARAWAGKGVSFIAIGIDLGHLSAAARTITEADLSKP